MKRSDAQPHICRLGPARQFCLGMFLLVAAGCTRDTNVDNPPLVDQNRVRPEALQKPIQETSTNLNGQPWPRTPADKTQNQKDGRTRP